MSTTNVTLRINSYQTKNRILSKKVDFSGTSKAKNCESASILDCVTDFFEAVTAEVNDDFSLTVCGNVFEQAYVQAEAERWNDVISCTAEPYSMVWPSRNRLQFLKEAIGADAQVLSVSVTVAGNHAVSLPEYPLVSWDGAAARKLVVSGDLREIEDFFEEEDCEPVAFWVGGHSCQLDDGRLRIIGCTTENVQSLVCGYLETRYINPFIGDLARNHGNRFNVYREPAAVLLDRIDPYYFIDKNNEKVKTFLDDQASLGLHAVSTDANEIVRFDSFADLTCVEWVQEPVRRPADENSPILTFNTADPRQAKAVQVGACRLWWEQGNTGESLSVEVTVVPHVYIQSISSMLLDGQRAVKTWRIGAFYAIHTQFEPKNAEDGGVYRYESSNPSVARIVNGYVEILKEGSFTLITKAKQASHEAHYTVSGTTVKSISVDNWLETGKMAAGFKHEVSVSVAPGSANLSGFTCEVVHGSRCVSVTKRSKARAVITAKRPGKCTIRFASKDNPEVFCEESLTVIPAPPRPRLFTYIGIAIAVFGFIALGTTDAYLFFPCLALAALIFAVACYRREKRARTIFICAALACLLLYLGGTFWQKAQGNGTFSHKVTEESISELQDAANSLVLTSVYVEDPYLSKIQWRPISVAYLGYVLCEDWGEHNLFLLYDVAITNPDVAELKDVLAIVQYEGKCRTNGVFYDYNAKRGTLVWEATYQDWLDSYTNNEAVCATSFSPEDVNRVLGLGSFVLSEADITQDELRAIVAKCANKGDLNLDEVSVAAIHLSVSDSVTASIRNKLYVYLQKDVINETTQETTSYFFPFCIENLKTETNENGQKAIVLENLSIVEYAYALRLEDATYYELADVIKLDYQ